MTNTLTRFGAFCQLGEVILIRAAMSKGSWLLAAGFVSWCAPVHAEPDERATNQKATCVSGFEQSQVFRQSGKFKSARAELLKCVQPICPQVVQDQCNSWLEEVEDITPSVVIAATERDQDRSNVRVEVDGVVVTETLTGRALEVDPGPHTFRFVYADYPPVEKKLVLRVGDKLRAIDVAFQRASPAEESALPPPKPSTPIPTYRPIPALAYALGGVALIGGGAFAYLGLTSVDRRKQLERECAPDCASGVVDPLHTRLIAADISLGVGIAALVGAAISYATRPSLPTQSTLSGKLSVTPQGLTLTF